MNSNCFSVISGALLIWSLNIEATPSPVLPRSPINVDSRWLNQLPPLILPLPKPRISVIQAPHSATKTELSSAAKQPIIPLNSAFASELLAADWPPPILENDPLNNTNNEPSEAAEMINVLETTTIDPRRSELTSAQSVKQSTELPQWNEPPPSSSLSSMSSRYRWHVQLLAGRALERVKIDQRTFLQRYGFLLQGLTLTISQSRYGDVRDEFYRLRAIEWSNKAEAVEWCHQLRTNGHQCFVTRITLPTATVITP